MADERVAESFPQVEGRQGSWSLPGAAGTSSQAQHVTGQQLAVSWLPAALMSRVVGPGHHHYKTRCHPVRREAGSDCMHEYELQAEAEVEADFQASRLVGLESECLVVVAGLGIDVYPLKSVE